jgi:hypothetical protein
VKTVVNKIVLIIVLLCIVAISGSAQFYTGSNNTFGKNRVQYNPMFWQEYNFQRFHVYFTGAGKEHAIYTAKAADRYLQEVEAFLDYDIMDKLQFVVFNSQSAFRQSNIGLRNDESTNIGGITRVDGNKIFIFYEGDHDKLDRQIRSGIASIVVYKLMYGDNWKDALKSSTILTFPDWFINGFTDYMAGDWTTEIDNKVKDGVLTGSYDKFNRLEGEDSRLAGYALWNYIDEVYGKKMIPNILYMTRVSRNVESGYMYVLGTTLKTLSKDFVAYYKERYSKDDLFRIEPTEEEFSIKTKKTRKYQQFKMSPNGNYAAYVTNELGQYKVWLYDVKEQKSKKIARGEHKLDRLPDYSHPVLAWHPTSKVLSFIEEKRGELVLNIYDIEEKKRDKRPLRKMDKVLSMSYNSTGKKLMFSAVKKGQTDLFLYSVIGNNQKQLTNDIFDDLSPRFVDNDTRVIFTSNRIDDTIRKKVQTIQYKKDKDIYILDIDNIKKPLTRITNTPYIDESSPNQYSKDRYSYLSNANGIRNRYVAYYDSAISFIDTAVHYKYFSVTARMSNYSRDVLEYDPIEKSETYSMLMLKNGKYHFHKGEYEKDRIIEDELVNTQFMSYWLKSKLKNNIPVILTSESAEEIDSNYVDINNYQFYNDKAAVVEKVFVEFKEGVKKDSVPKEDKETFKLPRQELYYVNFTTDYVVSQVDNSFLNKSYQRFTGGGYQASGFNTLIKMGMIDLFEDYRIIGGFRFPVNFNNTEYMLSFENLKSRMDKKYLASRQSFTRNSPSGDGQKVQTYEAKYNLKFPFNEVASLRLTNSVRYDKIVTLSTEPSTLEIENENHYLAGVKLDYVFDNTRVIGLNILNGTRFKVWGEFYRELDKTETDFFVFGVDFRHYQKIHRNIVFATRIAANTSIGHQRLLSYLGGVDNWLGPQFDYSILPDPSQNYQFQTIATPVRGFYQNVRNGNSFALINNELRVPVFKYFSNKPIKSSFLENFMVVGFGDVGSAWTGKNPYTSDNAFNTILVEGFNYEIFLQNQKEPIVYGYGFGLRSKLFGYYVRFDFAWGVDDGVVLDPVKYLSLSLDF